VGFFGRILHDSDPFVEEPTAMKRLIFILLLVVCCVSLASCGSGGKEAGELCAANNDCESEKCGFGPCPSSGPECPEGEECECLVCL
jgi:hypothetical protein